jgi:hypothetical protein
MGLPLSGDAEAEPRGLPSSEPLSKVTGWPCTLPGADIGPEGEPGPLSKVTGCPCTLPGPDSGPEGEPGPAEPVSLPLPSAMGWPRRLAGAAAANCTWERSQARMHNTLPQYAGIRRMLGRGQHLAAAA